MLLGDTYRTTDVPHGLDATALSHVDLELELALRATSRQLSGGDVLCCEWDIVAQVIGLMKKRRRINYWSVDARDALALSALDAGLSICQQES